PEKQQGRLDPLITLRGHPDIQLVDEVSQTLTHSSQTIPRGVFRHPTARTAALRYSATDRRSKCAKRFGWVVALVVFSNINALFYVLLFLGYFSQWLALTSDDHKRSVRAGSIGALLMHSPPPRSAGLQ